jgi:sigma-B regulation protein RsbU (phosphoserine phosphatase)
MGFATPRIRTLLVDDEQPARVRLRQMLGQFSDVEVVGEASDGDEALEQVTRVRPDLVFLDIQMPGRDGIQVAAELAPPRPQVIFCTAFDRYAVDAFEQHAIDYLLKPVNRARLEASLDRVRDSLGSGGRLPNELKQAGATQARLFPQRLPTLPSLDYTGSCRPAGDVGGDYYDFFEVAEGRLGIALGDVAGKGMPAALLMANLQGQLRSRVQQQLDLAALMSQLNQAVCELTDDNRFITFFFGIYDDSTQRLRYCNAGHNPPLLFRTAGESPIVPERLEAGGPVLGVLPDAAYTEREVALQDGDLGVFFSDGIVEATDEAGLELGEERLAELVLENRSLAAVELRDRLLEEVTTFSQGRQDDDITLIVIQVRTRVEESRESPDRR